MIVEIPLLALNTVLFPGGTLQLRVSEARHLQLVTQVVAGRKSFGVVLVALDGQKAGEPFAIGCTGKITYWAMEKPGVMQVSVLGLKRFNTITRWRHANGLLMAWVLPSHKLRNPVDQGFFTFCQRALHSLLEKDESPKKGHYLSRFDDPDWVSFRLAEKLPLDVGTYQYLLQIEDTERRLKALAMLARDRVLLEE
jgi:Lon protease-like protein